MEEELAAIVKLFSGYPRPAIFTNVEHCPECAEHNEELAPFEPATIQREHLGHMGWDPITFSTDAAFLYFFSGVARVAAHGNGDNYYLTQFLSHVSNRRELFSEDQKLAIVAFLERLGVVLAEDIELYGDKYELENVQERLVV
jgi:hypothetical protein